jgi:hypothetical protein
VTEPANTSAVPQASLWEDFIDIFTSPSQVFRRRENSGFGMPLLVFIVILAILVFGTKGIVQPALDAEMVRQGAAALKSHPGITAEQLQKQREIGEKLGPIFLIIFLAIAAMLTGLVLWLVGKMFDSKLTPSQAVMVSTYAFFPKLLSVVAAALIAYLSNPDRLNGMARLTLGLGTFLDPDKTSPVLLALLVRLDVFTLWETALLAIGLHVVGRVSKSDAYLAAAIVWLIGALPSIIGALRA